MNDPFNSQMAIAALRIKMFFVKWFLYWAFFLDGIVGIISFGEIDAKMVARYRVWLDKI